MATEGEFPKVDGDLLYASEVNRFKYLFQDVYNTIEIGSITASSGVGTTLTAGGSYVNFYLYNEGAVNAYVTLGSPASNSGLTIFPGFNNEFQFNGSQISCNTTSGTTTIKYIAQGF